MHVYSGNILEVLKPEHCLYHVLQAKLALDQFHTTDRANRKQFYHMNRMEPRKPGQKSGQQIACLHGLEKHFELFLCVL